MVCCDYCRVKPKPPLWLVGSLLVVLLPPFYPPPVLLIGQRNCQPAPSVQLGSSSPGTPSASLAAGKSVQIISEGIAFTCILSQMNALYTILYHICHIFHTSMTPFSLMIMHQCVGSALLELPSLPEGAGAAELRLISSFGGAALALESPYSISSSSSTTLLHTHFTTISPQINRRVPRLVCVCFGKEVMWILTWGPGWWSQPQTDSWCWCPLWRSSSLCFLWWTCRSHPGTRTVWSHVIAVQWESVLAKLNTVI